MLLASELNWFWPGRVAVWQDLVYGVLRVSSFLMAVQLHSLDACWLGSDWGVG
jgi:hypothetical protein